MATLNSGVPKGELKDKWTQYKDSIDLVNPANKWNIDVIVVGTGLAGGSASATLAELGYNVKTFCYQDSPRRAHSIANGTPWATHWSIILVDTSANLYTLASLDL